ncbi:helix-turn-helix transcriptional regulator [Nocardia sp. NPDC051030]|uniref:helix-turn-helix domain-containing protein n=1 Tax=Nocardia sp. NPDC051030 TaxID=3155162 RepID=UPI003427B980
MGHREQGREALTQQLLQLRGEHSELSLRTIAMRAQVSHTTVSRAFSTQGKLPSWTSIAAIAQVLGGDSVEVEPLWQWASTGTPQTRAQLAGEAPPRSDPPTPTRLPWFIPVCAALAFGLILPAAVAGAMTTESTAYRWLAVFTQAVFAIAAAIAFGLHAFRAAEFERRWLVFACLASACWGAAMVWWILAYEIGGNQHGVMISEIGFHTYSPLMIIALWLRLRNNPTASAARENTVQTVALTVVAALSVPGAVWLLSALPHARHGADETFLLRTYLYPLADGAMIALALLASVRGIRVTQSRLLAVAFGADAIAVILATNSAIEQTADLPASAEFASTAFAVLLALAAIAPIDNRIRPAHHQYILTRVLQATGLAAIVTYTVTLATGHLAPAITPIMAAGITLLLVIALVTSLHQSHS